MRRFTNDCNRDGKEKRRLARESVGNKCIRCQSASVPGRILTIHHMDGDKSNDQWYNLLPLCQVCHLQIQARLDHEKPCFLEHSQWLKPYIAGFYARKYEAKHITREEAMYRLDQLLRCELRSFKKDPVHFTFYPRHALASYRLRHLTSEEFRAYMYLLWSSWLQTPRATLPNSDSELSALAGGIGIQRWLIVKPAVLAMLSEQDGRLIDSTLYHISNGGTLQ